MACGADGAADEGLPEDGLGVPEPPPSGELGLEAGVALVVELVPELQPAATTARVMSAAALEAVVDRMRPI